jgi:hypothetical protein
MEQKQEPQELFRALDVREVEQRAQHSVLGETSSYSL